MISQREESKYWQGSERTVFKEIARYNPNEENDTWIKYENVQTKQEYTCRLEAFLSRFSQLPNE